MNLAAVVFDLDGTLVDSRPDITTAVNRLRAEIRLPPLASPAVGAMVGEGSRVLVHKAIRAGAAPIDGALFEHLHRRFLELYAEVCTCETRPYEGVEELLAGAVRRWPMAVLTNKPMAMTRAVLESLDWTRLFRVVIGGDSRTYRKPDGRGLSEIAAGLAVAPADLLMVGDSRIDAETAGAAGTRFVWAEWGYAGLEDRHGLAGGVSARSPAALGAWLEAPTQ